MCTLRGLAALLDFEAGDRAKPARERAGAYLATMRTDNAGCNPIRPVWLKFDKI
jgi:hypothetical protein